MRASSKIILTLILVVIAGLILTKLLAPNPISDNVQIANQIQSAAVAASDKNVGGVMSIVSDNYNDGTFSSKMQLTILLRRALSDAGEVQVLAAPPTIVLNGDEATSLDNIEVRTDGQLVLNQVISLQWKKEETRRYFIFPDKVWRVTRSNYSGVTAEF